VSTVRVLDAGPLARLIEVEPGSAATWAAALRAAGLAGVVEVVPAARTVLVRCADPAAAEAVARAAPSITCGPGAERAADGVVEIPVHYDGEDLAIVAERAGLAIDEVIARHAGSAFRVEFCGFAPGFAYLGGLDPALHLPRRATPRTRVPAGAVAIASAYSAVYPGASPGGWHLIGQTEVRVWDVERDPPALLEPGATVRFVPA
jgi:KipI family sensor histidine kinase inhibitor